jgi:hypothetical protein
MDEELPPLVGPPSDVAQAASIRERFVRAMEDAARDGWRQFQRSRSDDWQLLMHAEEEQALAFAAVRSKADPAWWIARRDHALSALVREVLQTRSRKQAAG